MVFWIYLLITEGKGLMHCKYIQCNFYNFYVCPRFHCMFTFKLWKNVNTETLIYALTICSVLVHTAAFWNITIQWTSHDDLTKKNQFFSLYRKNLSNHQKLKLHFAIWQKTTASVESRHHSNLQINVEAKRMDGLSWKKDLNNTFYSICCRLSPFHREWFWLES